MVNGFRLVRTADEALVKRLHTRLFPDTEFEGKGNAFWLILHGKEAVAFASARESRKEPDAVFLSRSGVIPSARGHHLQQRLIRARVRWARKEGFMRAVTYCLLENVPSARNLSHCGFLPYWPKPAWAGKVWYFEKTLE